MTIMPWSGHGMNPEQPWMRQKGLLGQRRKGLFGASAGYAPGDPLVPGNLPTGITQRVRNPDGSTSTVRTMSFGNDQGEVLVPTVIGGRVVSDDEAIDHYNKTGENFGIFKTPEDATAYGQRLHSQHAAGLTIGDASNRAAGMFGAAGKPQKPGFDWRKLLGVLGDSLSIAGGGQPMYVPMMMQARQLADARAYAEQEYQRRRTDGFTDWQRQEQWKRDNPQPRNPTTFEQILDAAGIQGDERVGLLRRKAESDAAGVPVGIDVQNPDGSVTRQYVRPGTLGGGMTPPPAPVGKLKPYGGQSATPAGTFR